MISFLALALLLTAASARDPAYKTSPNWLRAAAFTQGLTNEEKANLTTGVGLVSRCTGNTGELPRFGFPSLCFSDGPAGVALGFGTTAFPAEVVAAATWDKALIYQRALAQGLEFRKKGIHVAFSPVTGGPLGRSPYAGRNWESFGSDPYLNGIASYWAVKGIQDAGVIATPKHFVAYEQETLRWTGILSSVAVIAGILPISTNVSNAEQIDSIVTNRTLRELYLWPFEEAMRAKPLAMMCSYNRVNGEDACSNAKLLNIAKDEWEFGGFIVSDYGSSFMVGSTKRLALGGMDMDLPGGEGLFGAELVLLAATSKTFQARLDDMATRVVYAYFESGQDYGFPTGASLTDQRDPYQIIGGSGGHANIAREVAEAGTVLLKNSNSSGLGLPLRKGIRIGLFGTDAGPSANGRPKSGIPLQNSPNNGTVFLGFGSGYATPSYLIDPFSAISWRARDNAWDVSAVLQDDPAAAPTVFNSVIDFAEACLVFVSALAGESRDRTSLRFDNAGDDLITYVADRCANTIVVSHIPGPTNMEIAFKHPNVTAILNAGYAGQESGRALVSILEGSVNPSGKLVYTILQNDKDYITVNSTLDNDPKSFFSENLLIDYRQADANNKPVRFEFGYGLSYTSFDYSDVQLRLVNKTTFALAGRDDTLMSITAKVRNIGKYDGAEVSQLYISFASGLGEPPKVLRGFTKSYLGTGKSSAISFEIRKKDISIWDDQLDSWALASGETTFLIGPSSRNLPLTIKTIL